MGYPQFDIHGFRSSFSVWANRCTSYNSDLVELSLAHKVGTSVKRIYDRDELQVDKRRPLMDDWAAFVTGQKVPSNDLVSVQEMMEAME